MKNWRILNEKNNREHGRSMKMMKRSIVLAMHVWASTFSFFYLELTYAAQEQNQTQQSHSLKQVLPHYLKIQAALATDTLQGVHEAALTIQKSADFESLKDVKRAILRLTQTRSLSEARKAFKELSVPFVKWVESEHPSGMSVMYCSMAGAKWIQKEGPVSNPYYGKEMSTCGEKLSS